MPERITRKEFNSSIGRLHEEVKEIRDCSRDIKADAKYMKDATQQFHQVLFGNGREGLITKVYNVFTILAIHRWLMCLIVAGVLTTAFFVIRKNLGG